MIFDIPHDENGFQPTLPARGATGRISSERCVEHDFNPRSPHGERPGSPGGSHDRLHFNPRSPHGERPFTANSISAAAHFNPRSPHGERLHLRRDVALLAAISTHAPRTGSDGAHCPTLTGDHEFQPTLPARGATPSDGQSHRRSSRFQPTLPARGATKKLLIMF